MHRYRDAIYYSKEHEPYRSKEIIGGYILFPGRGDDEYISQRYFSTSVEEVNIGAFPLLPNANEELEGRLLKQHLHKILIEHVTTESHVSKAKPQRTLAYVSEEEKAPEEEEEAPEPEEPQEAIPSHEEGSEEYCSGRECHREILHD